LIDEIDVVLTIEFNILNNFFAETVQKYLDVNDFEKWFVAFRESNIISFYSE